MERAYSNRFSKNRDVLSFAALAWEVSIQGSSTLPTRRGTKAIPDLSTLADYDIVEITRRIKKLPKPLKRWFEYAYTSTYDLRARVEVVRELRDTCANQMSKEVGLITTDNALKYLALVEALLASYAPGSANPTLRQLSTFTGVPVSTLVNKKCRWPLLKKQIQERIGHWDNELINALT